MERFSAKVSFLLGAGSGLLLLASCAAGLDVQIQCLPLVTYTAAEQVALLSAYDKLPPGSMLKRAVQDYLAMRDADRACQRRGGR